MTVESIIHKVRILKAGIDEKAGNYEWELGKRVLATLEKDMLYNTASYMEIKYLMGIPVRINVVNPECIKLWREIKA